MASFFERAKLATRTAIGVFSENSMREAHGMFQGIYPSSRGEPPVRGTRDRLAAYRDLPWLRACAERVGNAVASTEWQLFVARKGGTAVRDRSLQRAPLSERRAYLKHAQRRGDVTRVEKHVLLDDVLDKGNSFLTGHATRKVTQLHVDLAGEGFWLKERDGLGTIVGVWPIPPHWIIDTPTPGHRFYQVSFRGWQGSIPDSEILWMANPDPENPYARGTGITGSMAMDLETDEYAKKWMRQFFYNSGRPDFVVFPKASGGEPGQMSPVEAKRLEQSWLSQHQGFWRAFKPMFASREIGIHEFQQNMQTTQGIPLLEHERNVIVQTWGFPPEILGVLESSNRATIDGAAYIMAKYVIEPRLEFFRAIWQERLIPEYDDRLILDFVSPVQDDKVFQLEGMKAAPWAPTVDEWREIQGLPPDKKDGSKRLVPFQLQAVDSLDDVHVPTGVDPGGNPPIPEPEDDDDDAA